MPCQIVPIHPSIPPSAPGARRPKIGPRPGIRPDQSDQTGRLCLFLAPALLASLLPLPLLPPAAFAAIPAFAFEGHWDCAQGRFEFTSGSYRTAGAQNGAEAILSVESEGDTFTLTLTGQRHLALAMNPDGTMTWFSQTSGNSFLCHRAKA